MRHLCLYYVRKKHKFKSFTKSPPASLLHCIGNFLKHPSGKCHDSLTMGALSFIRSTGLCTIFISRQGACPLHRCHCGFVAIYVRGSGQEDGRGIKWASHQNRIINIMLSDFFNLPLF